MRALEPGEALTVLQVSEEVEQLSDEDLARYERLAHDGRAHRVGTASWADTLAGIRRLRAAQERDKRIRKSLNDDAELIKLIKTHKEVPLPLDMLAASVYAIEHPEDPQGLENARQLQEALADKGFKSLEQYEDIRAAPWRDAFRQRAVEVAKEALRRAGESAQAMRVTAGDRDQVRLMFERLASLRQMASFEGTPSLRLGSADLQGLAKQVLAAYPILRHRKALDMAMGSRNKNDLGWWMGYHALRMQVATMDIAARLDRDPERVFQMDTIVAGTLKEMGLTNSSPQAQIISEGIGKKRDDSFLTAWLSIVDFVVYFLPGLGEVKMIGDFLGAAREYEIGQEEATVSVRSEDPSAKGVFLAGAGLLIPHVLHKLPGPARKVLPGFREVPANEMRGLGDIPVEPGPPGAAPLVTAELPVSKPPTEAVETPPATTERIEERPAAETPGQQQPQQHAQSVTPTAVDFTEADIEQHVGRLDNPGQLGPSQFAMAAPVGPDVVNPATGQVEPAFGLSNMTIEGQNANPNQIGYHENAYFRGITDVRPIDAFPTGPKPKPLTPPGAPVPTTEVRITGPSPGSNRPRPVISSETGGNVEVRLHGPNPKAPEGFSHDNPTVQVNTPSEQYPWVGKPAKTAAGERANIRSDPAAGGQSTTGRYRTADDQWLLVPTQAENAAYAAGQPMPPGVATPEQVASAHYPVYGEPVNLGGGPHNSGGTPPIPLAEPMPKQVLDLNYGPETETRSMPKGAAIEPQTAPENAQTTALSGTQGRTTPAPVASPELVVPSVPAMEVPSSSKVDAPPSATSGLARPGSLGAMSRLLPDFTNITPSPPSVLDRIPPPDPVLKDPAPPANAATGPNVTPSPPPVMKPPAPKSEPTGKTSDIGVGAPPKQKSPPASADAPGKPVTEDPKKTAGFTSQKNPVIDSKRQLQAKTRVEQTETELQTASREKASAEQKLLSAQARVRAVTDHLRMVPQHLQSESRAILRESDLDERLQLVNEIRASRDDWSPEEKGWLDQQAELLDAQLDVEAAQFGQKKQGANVRDSTILMPTRQQELARASKSVADLIRSEGPNYRTVKKVNYDEVMGKKAWDEFTASRAKGASALALNPDHIISVREIRDEVVKSGLLELYDKASPAIKEQIEKAIQDLGDERRNLVAMEEFANKILKRDRSWWDIPYEKVAKLYTLERFESIRTRETEQREHFQQVIQALVTRFSK